MPILALNSLLFMSNVLVKRNLKLGLMTKKNL